MILMKIEDFGILLPILVFVGLYSCLAHKELRFIFYAFPILNLVSAYGLAKLFRKADKNSMYLIIAIILLVATLALTCIFLYVSSLNYPGGYGLYHLHKIVKDEKTTIHIDTLAAMTGVSRFGEINPNWSYFKTENLTLNALLQFDYLLTGNQTVVQSDHFTKLGTIDAFSRIETFPPRIILEPALYILKNNNPQNK